jgi:hypothetical protein
MARPGQGSVQEAAEVVVDPGIERGGTASCSDESLGRMVPLRQQAGQSWRKFHTGIAPSCARGVDRDPGSRPGIKSG